MVERSVEARQGEVRALPRPPQQHQGREPDGDGTALISRDDVVRLHDALPLHRATTHARRVGQWQTACLTNRASEVRFLPRRLWPRSEVVETPGRGPGGSRFESGRSPHRFHADVAQPDPCEVVEREPHLALNQEDRVRVLASQPRRCLCTCPLKVHEYLAHGLPVVSVDIPEVRNLAPDVELAGNAAEFLAALDRAVARGKRPAPPSSSWSERVDDMVAHIRASLSR